MGILPGGVGTMAILIKRYENRKLYDTEHKRYISLEEIAGLVRQGEEIRVVDNATGADLTAETLTKILMDEGRKGRRRLPSEFLHDLVRWGDKVRASTVDQVEQRLDRLVEVSLDRLAPLRQLREDMSALTNRMEQLEASLANLAGRRPDPRAKAEAAGQPTGDDSGAAESSEESR